MKPATCIIAVANNSWGRGQTIDEALKNLVKSGGFSNQTRPMLRARSEAKLRFIVGDDRAYIDEMGTLMLDVSATSFKLTED